MSPLMPAVRAEPTPTPVTASGDIAAAAGDFVHNDGFTLQGSLVLRVTLP